jgi:hypothetical protein
MRGSARTPAASPPTASDLKFPTNQKQKETNHQMKIDKHYDTVLRMVCSGNIGITREDREEYARLLKIDPREGGMSQADYDAALKMIELDEQYIELLREGATLIELINEGVADEDDFRRWKEIEPEITASLDLTRYEQEMGVKIARPTHE